MAMAKMIKKTTALLLAVMLLAVSISACGKKNEATEPAQPEEIVYQEPTIVLSQVHAQPGDQVTMQISLRQSPGIAACRLILEFDNEVLQLETLKYGETFRENGVEPGTPESPVPIMWSQLENFEGDADYAELTFRVSDSAKALRVYNVTASFLPEDIINLDEQPVAFAVQNGSVTIDK